METKQSSASTEEMTEEFVDQVSDALEHLYDYAHLQRHPLTGLVCDGVNGFDSQAKALRHVLLDVLEELNPGDGVTRSSREWRTYDILTRRYVDGYTSEETMRELHTSLRQLQRDQRKGLLAVASILWHRSRLLAERQVEPQDCQELGQEIQQLGLAPERIDLAELVEGIMAPAKALASASGVLLAARPDPEPVLALSDVTLSRQALLGACAVLVSARPHSLEIGWGYSEDRALIHMRARGISSPGQYPMCDSERVSMATSLMRTQGGDITISSDSEHGACSVVISFARAESPSVLLIDDNEQVLQLFERYLVGEGYKVTATSDALRALRIIERESPKVVVLDVMMRDVDGWQLLQQMRLNPKLEGVPIIVCTILNEPELARALGAQYYLKKPVSQQEMLLALRTALARV